MIYRKELMRTSKGLSEDGITSITYSTRINRKVKLIDWRSYIKDKLKELRLGTDNLNIL